MNEKKIAIIFGKRGSGKSYLAAHLLSPHDRYVIYDTLHEYRDGVVCEDMPQLCEIWRNCYRRKFKLIYRPINPEAEFDAVANLVWICGDVAFLVEEVDTFSNQFKISDEFANVIQRGRHRNITLIGVSQRPYGIHRLLTSQAKEICVFNTNEPRDREYLRGLLGQEIEARLDQLKQYEFIRWEDGKEGLEITKI